MKEVLSLGLDPYHSPAYCSKCGGVMIFRGVGEYRCEDCGNVEYDDYGKVRVYIENHKGATATEIEAQTGARQKTIRLMLKENRLEITADSHAFLNCEMCGAKIRAGRLCQKCETVYHERLEAMNRRQKNLQGFGMALRKETDGEKRLRRDE